MAAKQSADCVVRPATRVSLRLRPGPYSALDVAAPRSAAREPLTISEPAGAPAIARIEVCDTMARAEPFWRALEGGAVISTAYQRFDLLSAWHRHVGAKSGITPFIVVA